MMDSSPRLFYSSHLLIGLVSSLTRWGEIISLVLLLHHLGPAALPYALLLAALVDMFSLPAADYLRQYIPPAWMVGALALSGAGLLLLAGQVPSQPGLTYGLVYLTQRWLQELLPYYNWRYVISYHLHRRRYQIPRLIMGHQIFLAASSLIFALLVAGLPLEAWLWLWKAGLLLCALAVGVFADEFQALPHWRGYESPPPPPHSPAQLRAAWGEIRAGARRFWGLELGGLLSVSAFCLTFVFSVLLYENARIFEQHFSSPQDLARWYGFVAALASLVSLGLQFGLIPRLMRRFQLEQLSRFYVGALAASFVLLQALPALGPALLNELARWGVFGSLYEPMHFQIRGTLPTRQQAWARALLEGFSQNLGRLAASLSLLLMLAWGLPMLFIMALCLAALGAFVYANRQMLALYRQSIHSSLRSGQYAAFRRSVQEQLSFQQSIVQELLGRLAEVPPDDRDILLVAEALADTGAAAAFPLLLQKWPACPPGLQAELMLIMAEGWPQKAHRAELQKIVRQTLKSSDPRLCLAALRTVQIYPELLDSFLLAGRFLDPNPQISTLAAQLLLQHPSPSLSQAAQAHLKWLAASGAGGERALAVRALVEGGVDRYGQRFVSLDSPAFQVDPSVRVRMGIVPALKGQALIRSAMDMSPAVRHLALAQMQARPHRHLALLRTALQSSHHGSPASYRLAATLEEWYLWTALASLQPRALQKQVIPHLERGLHQLDLVASLYLSLQELQKPQLEALLNQLVLEYRALLQAILAFMGACYGQTRLRSISRTLEQAPDPLSCQMAENDLARLCRPDLAAQVAGILKNKTIRILKAHRPGIVHHPRHAYEQLLQQDDLWLELLALYCLSQLPPEQAADLITRPPLIADLLERGRHSPDDLIRAATQHVRTQLSPPDTTRYNPAYEEGRPMLSIIERMVFLRKVRFFENLRLDQLRTLARICEELSLNAGDYILHKGEAGDRLFIIVQGQIKILDPLSPQESLVLAIRQAGEVIGEISLFDGGLRSATGIAQSPALLLVVNRDSLYEAIADDPGIAMDMLRAMAESVRHNNQELIRLSTRINSQELHIIEEAIREAIEQD